MCRLSRACCSCVQRFKADCCFFWLLLLLGVYIFLPKKSDDRRLNLLLLYQSRLIPEPTLDALIDPQLLAPKNSTSVVENSARKRKSTGSLVEKAPSRRKSQAPTLPIRPRILAPKISSSNVPTHPAYLEYLRSQSESSSSLPDSLAESTPSASQASTPPIEPLPGVPEVSSSSVPIHPAYLAYLRSQQSSSSLPDSVGESPPRKRHASNSRVEQISVDDAKVDLDTAE
ncbi:hypothetical protein V8F06_008601 [Rhypophila decipiens]